MKEAQYLLIGGGLACSQAAKILRMKDPNGSIMLVSNEPQLPYDRPPLSKELLRGEKTPEQIVYDPQSFFDDKKIDVVLGQPVVELEPNKKNAMLESGDLIGFDKALLATGGDPITLDIPGASLNGVYYLRTMNHAAAIVTAAQTARHAVVVGAGFIGMEVAASLTQRRLEVTLVESLPYIWPGFLNKEFAGYLERYCSERGIKFVTGESVTAIKGSGRVQSVTIASGDEIRCDMVCVGIGIKPSVALAQQAGLEIDNGVIVNEYLQTSHHDVYAGGDIVNFPDPIFGKRRRIEHWGHAEYCGQLAGLNMTGARQKYDLLSYVWSDIFDLHIEFAGDEHECDRVLTRGNLGGPTFTVLYLKNDKLRAYFAVNTNSREFPKMQRLIRQGVDLAGKDTELQNPTFELKELF